MERPIGIWAYLPHTIRRHLGPSGDAVRLFANQLFPWICFLGVLAWGWRIRNPFTFIPAYGDPLEVIWGIQYYYNSLFVQHISPLFTTLIFHPLGWHTATLAHTPVFFLATLPIYKLTGAAFTYNFMVITAFVVSFAGTVRFVRLFASRFAATFAALAFTFVNMRWLRIGGHLHILWASSLLPCLAWAIETARRRTQWPEGKAIWQIGLIWGMMINVSLYSIFLGGFVFLLLGKNLLHIKCLGRVIMVGMIALAIASPTIVLYWIGSSADQAHHFGIAHDLSWGASLNSLFVPSVAHPLKTLRQISRTIYTGPRDESGVFNLGMVTCGLALPGFFLLLRKKSYPWGLVWLTVGGLILSLGLLLKWNGRPVQFSGLVAFNDILWRIGHTLKPELFSTVAPSPDFQSGIPLPGLVLSIFVPFWESARVMSRYAFLGMLGAVTLAAITLQKSPVPVRILLALLWVIEILPSPTGGGRPVAFQLHPAYTWLTAQPPESGMGILDVEPPTVSIGGSIPMATWLHGIPTAAGVGSYWPEHTFRLWEKFLPDGGVLMHPQIGDFLWQYRIRYLFLHFRGNKDQAQSMWNMIAENTAFHQIGCFDPLEGDSPWPYQICVAEVNKPVSPFNVILQSGWSAQESWGIWSEGLASELKWLALARRDHHLKFAAFPLCVPQQHQRLTVKVNGEKVSSYQWEDCETLAQDLLIPASMIEAGWNQITFEYAYALTPAEVTNGQNPDARLLGVGFVTLEISR